MKSYLLSVCLFIFLAAGQVHGSGFVSTPANTESSQPIVITSDAGELPSEPPAKTADPFEEEYQNGEYTDNGKTPSKEERLEIADPLEPFNRAM